MTGFIKPLENPSGQLTVEAVLILTIFISVTLATSNALKQRNLLASVVQQPWSHIAGMVENGVWMPPQQGKGQHPNHVNRHGSPRGDRP